MANTKKKTPVKKKITKQKVKPDTNKAAADKKYAEAKKKASKKATRKPNNKLKQHIEKEAQKGERVLYKSVDEFVKSGKDIYDNQNRCADTISETKQKVSEHTSESFPTERASIKEVEEPIVQKRHTQKIVLNIRNISRVEKRVSLFNAAYDDREIFIESEFEKQVSYKEIVNIVKQGEYDIMSAYIKIVKGDFSSTLAYLGFGHTDKKITGQTNYTPLQLTHDAYQFQIHVCQEFINGSLQLNAGNTIDLNIQANTEIYLQILVSKI